jgi:hypothetical protein
MPGASVDALRVVREGVATAKPGGLDCNSTDQLVRMGESVGDASRADRPGGMAPVDPAQERERWDAVVVDPRSAFLPGQGAVRAFEDKAASARPKLDAPRLGLEGLSSPWPGRGCGEPETNGRSSPGPSKTDDRWARRAKVAPTRVDEEIRGAAPIRVVRYDRGIWRADDSRLLHDAQACTEVSVGGERRDIGDNHGPRRRVGGSGGSRDCSGAQCE